MKGKIEDKLEILKTATLNYKTLIFLGWIAKITHLDRSKSIFFDYKYLFSFFINLQTYF